MKVVANGIAQYYLRLGSGPPVVLIHALGLDHRLWEPQLSLLAASCTVFAYDVRGHGQSDVPAGPYSLAELVDDLTGLLEALGVDAAHLVGISLGGIIAQEFALAFPRRIRSLVLADTTSEYNQEARRQFAERARIAEERGMAPLVEPTIERWFTAEFRQSSPGAVAKIRQILENTHPLGYAATCRAIAQIDITERLVAVEAPTLVLVGSEDSSTPPEMALRIHEYIPGSRYVVISDVAHLSNVARSEEFGRAVLETVRFGESSATSA